MKKTILFLLLTVVSLAVSAQDAQPKDSVAFKFGYLSYDSVMVAVPDYTELKTNMAQLREQYEAEQKRVENDFNKKYEEFLDGQASFPKTIINMAVNIIAQERGYAFVLNTDKEAVTFINPALGVDITEAVKQLLNEETKNE